MRRVLLMLLLLPGLAQAYPLDGEPYTGIARLEGYRLAQEGKVRGTRQPPGGKLPLDQVDLRLVGSSIKLPPPDPDFSRQVADLMGSDDVYYSVAVLDLTDPAKPVYAEHKADARFNPGSVGKLVVASAVFQLLADLYPNDIAARERVLRESRVVADGFIVYDSHVVPFWDGKRLSYRPLRKGDAASLWTYLDWMLSASSNAAGSMVMREMLLLAHFGRAYPVSEKQIADFFRTTPKSKLSALLRQDDAGWARTQRPRPEGAAAGGIFHPRRQGQGAGRGQLGHPARTDALAACAGAGLDRGCLVEPGDQAPALHHPAAHSLCVFARAQRRGGVLQVRLVVSLPARKQGFVCGKYMGNVENLLNSAAIVEQPAGERRLHYMVVVSSNKLRVNSAVAHQTLGTRLQRLLEKRHLAAGNGIKHGLVHPDD